MLGIPIISILCKSLSVIPVHESQGRTEGEEAGEEGREEGNKRIWKNSGLGRSRDEGKKIWEQ